MHADFKALEKVEFDASVDLWRAVPEDVRTAHAVDLSEVAGAQCMTSRGIEPPALFRRAVGLGVAREASEADLDAVIAHMASRGQRYGIPLGAPYRPAALAAWLERRGLARGYAWMKFSRPCDASFKAATDVELRVVGREPGADFGRVVAEGVGLPAGRRQKGSRRSLRPGKI